MIKVESYIRQSVAGCDGYVPGEQPSAKDIIKLNTNENPYPPSPLVIKAYKDLDPDLLRRYPDPLSNDLRFAVSDLFNIPIENITVGNGSDEILAMLFKIFIDTGDKASFFYPTYILYETLANLVGAKIELIQLDDNYEIPQSIKSMPGKLNFIASPNSPVGTVFDDSIIKTIAENTKGIVVVDEAYAEFCGQNLMKLPLEYPNVVVIRTLSKSHSLAGLRVGFASASLKISEAFAKVKDSYNISRFGQTLSAIALRDVNYSNDCVNKVNKTKKHLVNELSKLGFKLYPSGANFIFAKTEKITAYNLYLELKKRNIFVRYFQLPRLDDGLRISIGTDEQINILISAIKDLLDI